ncbi:MAG: PepSY domain-containing protein [Boseongicola sp.]
MTLKNYRMISTGILVGLIPAAAFANFAVGDTIGTDLDEIRAKFEAQGYTVTEIEVEDDEIEVEYVLDGQEYEVTLNPDTGEVLEVELEDEDD